MTVRFSARGKRGEIWLYDQVGSSFWGEGISAKSFQRDLAALGKVDTIVLRINSPGGDVFDGFAIFNQLVQHPATIEVQVDGVAASIASIIAMAASPGRLRMARNSLMMIHNPQGSAWGDDSEMLRVAELLRTVKGNLAATYVDRTGAKREKVDAWMDGETWFTAEDAVAHGFADEVSAESAVTASWDWSPFRHAPKALRQRQGRAAGAATATSIDIHRQRVHERRAAKAA